MRNSFKVQESNKYLVESWDKANGDSKKHIVNIDESTYKSNLTSGKISILDSLKPQYETLKPATTGSTNISSPSTNFASKNKTSSPSTNSPSTSSPSTNTSSNTQSIGAFIPRNINKPWGK